MTARFGTSFIVVGILLTATTCAQGRGGRCPPSGSTSKHFEGVILAIDTGEKTVTLSQPSDPNTLAVVLRFSSSTVFVVDSQPSQVTSLRIGMTAAIDMWGRKIIQFTAGRSP